MANTGITRQQTFIRDARQYQREFALYLNTKLAEGKGLGLNPDDPEDKADLSDLPQFQSKDPTLDTSIGEAWVDMLLLAFMGVVFFMASYVSFVRSDVL